MTDCKKCLYIHRKEKNLNPCVSCVNHSDKAEEDYYRAADPTPATPAAKKTAAGKGKKGWFK